jgi:hypothetical protein
MARPGLAADSIDRERPVEKDNIDKRTPTTQAIPTTITNELHKRRGSPLILREVTVTI